MFRRHVYLPEMTIMNDLACTLANMLCAGSVEQTLSFALASLLTLTHPQWVCFLIWDADLKRYIIGETWLPDAETQNPAALRRLILGQANTAYLGDPYTPRLLGTNAWYHPLNARETHVGALCLGVDEIPPEAQPPYDLLVKALSQAIYTNARLEQADRERAELESDRQRLEQLLRAVEDQQRTIDQLLAAERQLSASLEAKVEERTAALRAAQNRLIQSEKLAVIGQLASSLAHELNNPLQAIESGLGLVMTQLNNAAPEVRSDLTIIRQELERIQTIFRQMLDFYRPVSHEHLPLDVNAICEGVRILMRKRLQDAGITLRLQLADPLPTPCGDSNQIKQVLLNLILNAAEAARREAAHIQLTTATQGQTVLITLADNGAGIPPEHLPRLFEPLFTTKTRGLGLGLAISREIIERHDGSINVASTPGKRTTFTIRLPVKETCDRE
jgi:signal transduction histidine kinase